MCDRKNVRVSKTNRNSNLWQLSHTKNTVVGFGGEWRNFLSFSFKNSFYSCLGSFFFIFFGEFLLPKRNEGKIIFVVYFPPLAATDGLCGLALKLGKLLGALFCRRDSKRFLLVVVEVARVAGALAFRDEVGLHLEREQKRKNDH